jgi:hypothetical protein
MIKLTLTQLEAAMHFAETNAPLDDPDSTEVSFGVLDGTLKCWLDDDSEVDPLDLDDLLPSVITEQDL